VVRRSFRESGAVRSCEVVKPPEDVDPEGMEPGTKCAALIVFLPPRSPAGRHGRRVQSCRKGTSRTKTSQFAEEIEV
jgi:hypothetical protein